MIHVIDLSSFKNSHLLYNVSVIKVLMFAYPDKQLSIYVQQTHWDLLNEYFSQSEKERILYKPVLSRNKNRTLLDKVLNTPLSTIRDANFFLQLVKKTAKKENDLIFLCTAHAVSFLTFKFIKKLYPSPVVISTLHGEVEFLYYSSNRWERHTQYLYKKIFATKSANFFYLFLNKISRQRLIDDNYIGTFESVEIDHPYIYNHNIKSRLTINTNCLCIGHVGSMGIRKNAHLLYELAKQNKSLIEDGLLQVSAVGPIEANVHPFKTDLVLDFTADAGSPYIPRETYDREIQKLDYAVFFYGKEQFIFRASGAIHDVINFNKPIIVLKHPYFDYLFEQAGNIGFICNDVTEMSDLISRIVSREEELVAQYERQCANIISYKKWNDIVSTALDLRKQIDKLIPHSL